LTYENYFKKISFLKLGFYSQVHYSTQNYFSNYSSSILSAAAFQPVPESRTRFLPQFRANKYLAVGSKNVIMLRKNIDFRIEGYLFMPVNGIEQTPLTKLAVRAPEVKLWPMGTSALVYFSPVGPVSLSLNYFHGEMEPFSFFLKFGYLIFNKRPF
jgi:NTE family protein